MPDNRIELNSTARKVLAALEMRSRDTFASIARKTKVSEQLVKYHVQRAKEEGFISEFNAIFDPSPLGYTLYLLYIRFLGVSSPDEKRWVDRCSRIRGVMAASLTFGRWNGFVAIWAKNQDVLQSIISDIIHPVGGKIAETQVTTRLHSYYATMQILSPIKQSIWSTVSIPKKLPSVDERDIGILRAISKSTRKSVAQIGEEIGLSPTAVQARLQKLEAHKVIVAYRSVYRYERLGLTQFRLLIRLIEPSTDIIKRVTAELFNTGVVFIIARHLGFADLDARGWIKDLHHLADIMVGIRDKFLNDILQIEVVPFLSFRYVEHLPIEG